MTINPSKIEEIRDFYLSLPDRRKLVFLAILSNSLTIDVRGFFLELSGERLLKALQGLNELQHQLSQHIAAIASGSERYPDDVLWNILSEKAEAHQIRASLRQSLTYVHSRQFITED